MTCTVVPSEAETKSACCGQETVFFKAWPTSPESSTATVSRVARGQRNVDAAQYTCTCLQSLGGTNSANMLNAPREREIPFGVLGNNVLGEWDPNQFDAVYSDDVEGAFDLTSQLIAEAATA